jgi:hypothetical protein
VRFDPKKHGKGQRRSSRKQMESVKDARELALFRDMAARFQIIHGSRGPMACRLLRA